MGTSSFVPEKSHVELTSAVHCDDRKSDIDFRKHFAIPLLSPSVDLTGHVDLFRDEDGLVSKSIEHWDRTPAEVLKSARFFQKLYTCSRYCKK